MTLSPWGINFGNGDIILGRSFKLSANHSVIFSLASYLYAPIDHYQSDQAVNSGGNYCRYCCKPRVFIISTSSGSWIQGDVSGVSTNHRCGVSHDNQTQTPKYEYQLYLRYNLESATQLGFCGGWIKGAGDVVNHQSLNDKLNTRYLRLSAAHFFTAAFQTELSLGRDLSVEERVKQDSFLSVRRSIFLTNAHIKALRATVVSAEKTLIYTLSSALCVVISVNLGCSKHYFSIK
nr:transporter [Rosenbergiella epipactidis]